MGFLGARSLPHPVLGGSSLLSWGWTRRPRPREGPTLSQAACCVGGTSSRQPGE